MRFSTTYRLLYIKHIIDRWFAELVLQLVLPGSNREVLYHPPTESLVGNTAIDKVARPIIQFHFILLISKGGHVSDEA